MPTIGHAQVLFAAATLMIGAVVGATAQGSDDDCRNVTTLLQLARIYGTTDIAVIERGKTDVCRDPTSNGTLRWPNTAVMRTAGGTWSYPNGIQARSAGGTWTYPNKEPAKSSGGTYYYPDGNVARSSGGTWTLPHRATASLAALLSWAGSRVPAADYERFVQAIGDARTDDQVLSAIELAWLAR